MCVRKNFPSLSAQPDLTAMRAWNENPEERTLLSFLVATCISLQGTKEPTLHQIIILTVMNRKISLLSLLGLSVFVLCYIQNTQAIPQQYSQGKCFSQCLLPTLKHCKIVKKDEVVKRTLKSYHEQFFVRATFATLLPNCFKISKKGQNKHSGIRT